MKWMNDQSQTLRRETCEDSRNAISSLVSQDGRKPCGEPECPQLDLFGQALAPARTTVAPEKEKAWKVKETYGRSSFGSSASADLSESLANRLARRLDTVGSTVYRQTWRRKVTPLGRSYWEHTARGLTTRDSGCTGWPTPNARDYKDLSRSNAHLAARKRHSPSIVTLLLMRGLPWWAISQIYGLMMGFGLGWHEAKLKATETPSA